MRIGSKISFVQNLIAVFYLSFLLLFAFSCKNKSDLPINTNISQEMSVSENKNINKDPNLTSKTLTTDLKSNKAINNKKQEKLPKLIDLGADKCIPCKMMKPILEELKASYAGKLDVEIIDVWENPKEGDKYGISIIPTQIFFDPEGKEFYRHEGFMSKEDILNTFKQKGMKLD